MGSAVVGMRCGGSTLGADATSDRMACEWDWSGVRRCGAGSAVAGMRCGGATLGDDAGVCVAAAGRRRAEGAYCTGERHTLGYGACGACETSGTAVGDQGPAAELKIVASWRMTRSWYWPSVAKGATRDGLASASIKSWAARWESLAEDIWSMEKLWGKKLTVLVMHLAAVNGM